jgi:hypothetical protein
MEIKSVFTPNIIDIEASGFGAYSYPIEVGVINQFGEKFCRLVKPLQSWQHWDESAESLHGISRDLLNTKGVPITALCHELNDFLRHQTVYSDGWVVDQPWLTKLFYQANVKMQFKLSPLEMILKESQMIVWQKTKQRISQEMKLQRHRASNDAALIQNTFVQTQLSAH